MKWVEGQAGFFLSRGGASGRRLAIAAGIVLLGAVGCDSLSKTTEISKTTEFAQERPVVHNAHNAQGQITGTTCVTIRRGVYGTVADTEVDSNQPNKNYGDSTHTDDGITGTVQRNGMFRFDLTGAVPPNVDVTSAVVSLTASGSTNNVNVHRITSAWNEMTVTWSSFNNAYSSSVEATFNNTSPTFSIESLVQQWADGTVPNYGFLLKQASQQTVYKSSEYAQVVQRPSLTVCYTCPTHRADCDGVFANGCEASTVTLDNCGMCGVACPSANASASCNSGTCSFVCNAGFRDCDGNPANACEQAGLCGLGGHCAQGADCQSTVCKNGLCAAPPPAITLTSPAANQVFGAQDNPVITLTGTVNQQPVTVTVNDTPATVTGGTFSAQVTLSEGNNFLQVSATNSDGTTGTESRFFLLDTSPPRAVILSPADGTVISSDTVTVTGSVMDQVIGTINSGNVTVTVNGVPATVDHGGFQALGVPVAAGTGTITVIATDSGNNKGSAVISVTRDVSAKAQIAVVSGDGQAGFVGAALANPFKVKLTTNTGAGAPNQPVTFNVTTGSGTFPGNARSVTVLSDTDGFAQATLRLGNRAAVASDLVQASADGFIGFANFSASAVPDPASPRALAAVTGGNQVMGASGAAPLPLTVLLTDSSGNPLPGQNVIFTVIQGSGHVNSQTAATIPTDGSGRALVLFSAGPGLGVNSQLVQATSANANAVTFTGTTLDTSNPSTSLSGVVLTNQNTAVANVEVKVQAQNLTVTTNAEGRFTLNDITATRIHLQVVPGQLPYPPLSFEMTLTGGAANVLDRPVYLPLMDPNGLGYANPDTDVVLQRDDTPGLVFTVPAGSATFTDTNSKTGNVQVIRVNRDKIPMTPPDGTLPTVAFAIMPATVHFDPPAPIRFPNVEGRKPGEIVTIFSYDHDLGEFVSVGSAQVSEDGQQIISGPGQGIVKGGWHLVPPVVTQNSCLSGMCKYYAQDFGTYCTGGTNDGVACPATACTGGGSCLANMSSGQVITCGMFDPDFSCSTDYRNPGFASVCDAAGAPSDPIAGPLVLAEGTPDVEAFACPLPATTTGAACGAGNLCQNGAAKANGSACTRRHDQRAAYAALGWDNMPGSVVNTSLGAVCCPTGHECIGIGVNVAACCINPTTTLGVCDTSTPGTAICN
jgi:hypothetical protein